MKEKCETLQKQLRFRKSAGKSPPSVSKRIPQTNFEAEEATAEAAAAYGASRRPQERDSEPVPGVRTNAGAAQAQAQRFVQMQITAA